MRSVQFLGGTLPITFLAILAGTSPARAQNAGGSTAKVAAETLFEEGRRLMGEGKIAEACPKFAEAQRLDPSPGTLLNLASCYEKSERPATAWATYREGASAASATGRQDLLAAAQRHADALYPALPRLTIKVASPVAGLTVALDGVSVGHAEWGMAVPVDPGEHTVEASAPHFVAWSTKVAVGKDAATTAIEVPALAAAPEAAPAPTSPPSTSPSSQTAPGATGALASPASPAPEPAEPSSFWSKQRAVGTVVGVVGIAGLGVSAVFAAIAKSTYNSSLADCESNLPNLCTSAGVSERNNAISAGTWATGFVVGGAVLAAAGLVVFLTAPAGHQKSSEQAKSSTQAASLGLVPWIGGGAIRGTW